MGIKVEHSIQEDVEGKECGTCKKWKPLAEYHLQKLHYDGYTSTCKRCRSKKDQQYLLLPGNAERKVKRDRTYRMSHKKQAQATKAEYRKQWLHFIKAEELACTVCGYNKCFEALDFHHNDPAEKEFGISQRFNRACNKTNQIILARELKKCRVLCRNCHAELHKYLKRK